MLEKVEKMCWFNMLKLFKKIAGHIIIIIIVVVFCIVRHQKTMVIFRVKKFGEWHSTYVLDIHNLLNSHL